MSKYLLLPLVCLATVGCADKKQADPFPVSNTNSKYIYEKKVEPAPVKPDVVKQSDYVAVFFSATTRLSRRTRFTTSPCSPKSRTKRLRSLWSFPGSRNP